jgi:hypothetical protein
MRSHLWCWRRGVTQKGLADVEIGVRGFARSNHLSSKGQGIAIFTGENGFICGILAFIELVNVIFMQYLC